MDYSIDYSLLVSLMILRLFYQTLFFYRNSYFVSLSHSDPRASIRFEIRNLVFSLFLYQIIWGFRHDHLHHSHHHQHNHNLKNFSLANLF